MTVEKSAGVPWSCRWARLGGSVRSGRTLDSPAVFWSCRSRDLSAPPLFTQEACQACARWEPAPRRVDLGAFGDVSDEAGYEGSGVLSVRLYRRGEPIVKEDTASQVLHTITRGAAKTFKSTPAGRTIGIEISGPGSPLLPGAVVDGSPLPASAVAVEPTVCVIARREDLVGLLERQPSLARELLLEVNTRLMTLMTRAAELAGCRIEARLARVLLALADKLGQTEGSTIVVNLPLSRQDLADLAATTIETCIRVMSRWDREGLVRRERRGFVLHDPEALERLAGGRSRRPETRALSAAIEGGGVRPLAGV